MSLGVEGLIINKLSKAEIMELPSQLNKLNFEENNDWEWQDEISETFLEEYWNRNAEYYTKNLGKKEIYKGAIIWANKTWNIHFFHRNLISIGIDRAWSSFHEIEAVKSEVNSIIQPILKLLKTNEIIYTYNLAASIDEDELNAAKFETVNDIKVFLEQHR